MYNLVKIQTIISGYAITICLAPDCYITTYNLIKAETIISGYASTMLILNVNISIVFLSSPR